MTKKNIIEIVRTDSSRWIISGGMFVPYTTDLALYQSAGAALVDDANVVTTVNMAAGFPPNAGCRFVIHTLYV